MKLIPTVRLVRVEESNQGTFGNLIICSQVFCVTLECPDKLNERNISSIPAQQYQCLRIHSPQFGETFEVVGVPNRSHVLFHAGNILRHTSGCILLAQHFGKIRGKRAILNSGRTFREFIEIMKTVDFFNLTIKEVY